MFRNYLTALPVLFAALPAYAQEAPPPAVSGGEPISTLMFFTFGAVLAIAAVAFLWFQRKRSNREATDRALNPNNPANK